MNAFDLTIVLFAVILICSFLYNIDDKLAKILDELQRHNS